MPIVLQPREIQVWLTRPDEVPDGQWAALQAMLDAQEQARAARFKLETDRRAYVLAHALRRRALSQALAVEPSSLIFTEEPGGKPVLLAPNSHGCFFSHTRSRGLVAFALTALQPIGVDVEAVQERTVDLDLLSRFVDLPDAGQRTAELGGDATRQFFFYWTALEAFWKAQGTGLASGNPRVRFARDPAGNYQLSAGADSAGRLQARLMAIEAPAGHALALAVKGSRSAQSTVEQPAISLRTGYQLVN